RTSCGLRSPSESGDGRRFPSISFRRAIDSNLRRVEDVAGFLARFPPFDELGREELDRVAAGVKARAFGAGEDVLVEDGDPATHLYVIRTGSMELIHQEEVIDVLEPGECFGHPSLLTGMAPAFTVRAHEESSC